LARRSLVQNIFIYWAVLALPGADRPQLVDDHHGPRGAHRLGGARLMAKIVLSVLPFFSPAALALLMAWCRRAASS
jgi:hypothetical protein